MYDKRDDCDDTTHRPPKIVHFPYQDLIKKYYVADKQITDDGFS